MDTIAHLLDTIYDIAGTTLPRQLLIILIYALLAKIADLFIDRVLKKLTARTSITYDDALIELGHRPICWTIFLLGLQHALVLQTLAPPWKTILPAVIESAILLLWFAALFRFIHWFVEESAQRMVERGKIGSDLFLLLKNVLRVVAVVAGLLWLLSIWNVNLTPLFASAGIAGIAVALAAKDTLANFFGGVSIFADRSFKVGDFIILDSGERGEVVEIGIRSTRIKTLDDVLITIPNSILATTKIVNESAPTPRYRIRIPVGVAYGSDVEEVEAILMAVALAEEQVGREPEPLVRFRAFGESSLDFMLFVWVEDPIRSGLVTHKLLKAIYKTFNDKGIAIPFPQRDVHLIPPPTAG
ncbi:MAG: mechanosensitive ion channel family protein [Thermodesulfobacteriota bacterium]